MTTLKQYLDGTKCEKKLKELIELIAAQGVPIRKAFISNQKYVDTKNIYGEEQIALDTWSNEHLIRVFRRSGLVSAVASEEEAEVIRFPKAMADYAVVMDPLDGSSLVQTNLAVGTIIGIYDNGDVMQKGRNMRAALYILYGPMTVLTLTVKEGVHVFALNQGGEYVMIEKNVKMPEGKIYASGALKKDWLPEHRKFITGLEKEGYKLRYSGSFVADVHQLLKYGGMFSYPAFRGHKHGKLRLLFEVNPLGFIITQAGGKVSDGYKNALGVMPEKIDYRTPVYIGSKGVIRKLEKMFNG